ncbi:MAG: hypothetical protein ACOX7F_07370 [Eubacteriales bacterium]
MKQHSKRWLALGLVAALAAGTASVSALDLSMDNYYEVGKEHAFTIAYNNSMNDAVREDMSETMVPDGMGGYTSAYYTSSTLVQKRIQDMQNEDANETAPYTIGNLLASYYTAQMSYAEMEVNQALLEDNIALMETMVQLGMKSELELLELKNSYNQLLNGKLALESSLAQLKGTLATQLGVTVEELNILELEDFSQEDLAGMKERLESKQDVGKAVEANNSLALMRYQASQLGNHQYTVMRRQIENTTQTLRISYESACQDMMNKYDSYLVAQQIYEKQQADFAVTEKQYELGMLSDVAYTAAVEQQKLNEQAVRSAALELRKAELKVDAFNEGVWLQTSN